MKLKDLKTKNGLDFIADLVIGSANIVGKFYDWIDGLHIGTFGLFSKSYNIMRYHLQRNAGNNIHLYDGYGTPIGQMSDSELNSKYFGDGWFLRNPQINAASNYINYVNTNFFNGYGDIKPNFSNNIDTFSDLSITQLKLENNQVGAVRGYEYNKNFGKSNGQLNPNNHNSDTRLGFVNNFYLYNTLYNASEEYETRKKNRITEHAYDAFGFTGNKGITSSIPFGGDRVVSQREVTMESIPWSTTDHVYDSYKVNGYDSNNIDIVKGILKEENGITLNYTENTQGINDVSNHLYYPFGNHYSLTYSFGLTSSSGNKTREYIAKSILGINLMDDTEVADSFFKYNNAHDISVNLNSAKKYYAGIGTRGTNYIDMITSVDVEFVKNSKNEILRSELKDPGADSLYNSKMLFAYAEAEGNQKGSRYADKEISSNGGVNIGAYKIFDDKELSNKKDLVYYTNKIFSDGQSKTLIARFHGDKISNPKANKDITQTAISKYGVSHGRNLLKETVDNDLYENPYCRVWTYHHQYATLKEVIRPFNSDGEMIDLSDTELMNYRANQKRLSEYGVRQSNGLVQIAPTSKDKVKKCMFSIENLAWKHEKSLQSGRKDQVGPFGGRIMWFPPYGLKFSESSNVDWKDSRFIGRGEPIFTYTNTVRRGNLSFKLLIDHPSLVNGWSNKGNNEKDGSGDVDDIKSTEQMLLRFFAGCQMLKKNERKPTPQKVKVEEEKKKQEPQEPKNLPPSTTKELHFFVFFPNNYSGVDDIKQAEGVSPLWYLYKGVGSGYYQDKIDKKNINEKTKRITSYIDKNNDLENEKYGYEMYKDKYLSKGYDAKEPNKNLLFNRGKGGCWITQTSINKIGNRNYWGYRCDKVYEKQVLRSVKNDKNANYYDTTSYCLNSREGFKKLVEHHESEREVLEDGCLFSFQSVFEALEKIQCENASPEVDELKSYLDEYDVVGVDINGFASSHGYNKLNYELSENRAKTIREWLFSKNPSKFKKELIRFIGNGEGKKLSHYDVNSFDAKVWRCSKVCIRLEMASVEEVSSDGDISISNINKHDNTTADSIDDAKNSANANNLINKNDYKRLNPDATQVQLASIVNIAESNRTKNDVMKSAFHKDTKSLSTFGGIDYVDELGYGGEYRFFNELKTGDPFLHNKLVDKIKYFDPAFHSITPEGFNSRLSFLHQCTRQGSTVGASDMHGNRMSSSNLAFGAPPICVLRIGDFYNTKIVIDNLQISYDDGVWDLNDEGIGVMPMMADVSMSFTFLGGSDLSGPISRLQNAVSFNYYANEQVYEMRSELANYDENGNLISINGNKKE